MLFATNEDGSYDIKATYTVVDPDFVLDFTFMDYPVSLMYTQYYDSWPSAYQDGDGFLWCDATSARYYVGKAVNRIWEVGFNDGGYIRTEMGYKRPTQSFAESVGNKEVTIVQTDNDDTIVYMRLKSADPVADTLTVRLYETYGGSETLVDTFAITNAGPNPYTSYYTLAQMFGVEKLNAGNPRVAVILSGAGPITVTGMYRTKS